MLYAHTNQNCSTSYMYLLTYVLKFNRFSFHFQANMILLSRPETYQPTPLLFPLCLGYTSNYLVGFNRTLAKISLFLALVLFLEGGVCYNAPTKRTNYPEIIVIIALSTFTTIYTITYVVTCLFYILDITIIEQYRSAYGPVIFSSVSS